MKILEGQSAVLTNFEVYTHLTQMKERYAAQRTFKVDKDKKKIAIHRPGNLQTIIMELMDYFEKPPSPLGSKPLLYSEDSIRALLEELRPYELTKAEIIMLMDTRPTHAAVLQNLIQEFDQRFEEYGADQAREDILEIVARHLGVPNSSDKAQIAAARDEAGDMRQADKDAPVDAPVVYDDIEEEVGRLSGQ